MATIVPIELIGEEIRQSLAGHLQGDNVHLYKDQRRQRGEIHSLSGSTALILALTFAFVNEIPQISLA
jgi:hypothetical protein